MSEDMQAQFDRIDALLHNVVVEQARARGDIEWLKANSMTRDEFKNYFGLILDRLDGLSGKFEDARYGSAKNAERLSDHETRLQRLERDAKPS
jgi:hypothetical protein